MALAASPDFWAGMFGLAAFLSLTFYWVWAEVRYRKEWRRLENLNEIQKENLKGLKKWTQP